MIEHIYVYGTLRRGQGACRTFGLEEHCEFVGTFEFPDAVMFGLGGFPGIHLTDQDLGPDTPRGIVGDLFKVNDPALLGHLDRYEGYDPMDPKHSLYLRKEIEVNGIPAYVYEYNHSSAGRRFITGGDWVEREA